MTFYHKQPPRHVLIVRLSAMGDVAMCVPVVKQLREDYPALRITVLTRGRFQVFFRDIKDIGFVTADFDKEHRGFQGLLRLIRQVNAMDIDAVADLHDVLRTKLLRLSLRLRGKKVAHIDKGRKDKKLLTRKFRKLLVQLTPSVERYRDTLLRLGLKTGELRAPQHQTRELSDNIRQVTGEKSGTWIGVAPFAQHIGKVYPIKLTDALINMLAERYRRVIIFGGGTHENTFAQCMEGRYPNVVSAIGIFSLGEEMDLISNIDCMVAMDSSTMHIASIEGTPVVSIWGATHPFAGFCGFGQNPDNAVQLDLSCRPCSVYGNKPCIYKDYRCLERIPPSDIVQRVEEVLSRGV